METLTRTVIGNSGMSPFFLIPARLPSPSATAKKENMINYMKHLRREHTVETTLCMYIPLQNISSVYLVK